MQPRRACGEQYKTDSNRTLRTVAALFTPIDQGRDEAQPADLQRRPVQRRRPTAGRFLDHYAIPDRYLALGLDRLSRDVDDKTQALVFIDFKSLGVRQLGSIYEGLLEFKLRIADREAGRDQGQRQGGLSCPPRQAKKPVAIASSTKGEVYLENDKRERKATGSYYTPDYIVKYIVEHTVGPVLERKFEALRPRLREAQQGYRDYAKLVEARRKAPAGTNP